MIDRPEDWWTVERASFVVLALLGGRRKACPVTADLIGRRLVYLARWESWPCGTHRNCSAGAESPGLHSVGSAMNPIAFSAVAASPWMSQHRTRHWSLVRFGGEEGMACVPQGALVFL